MHAVNGSAYVDSTELLFGSDNSAGTLSSIQCALSLNDSLARSTAAVGPASNLGNGIPVRHVGRCYEGVGNVIIQA